MKRHTLISLTLAVLLLCCLTSSAFATQAQLYYVTDEAGLFTDTQRETLESRAAEISEEYSFGVYIVTLSDYQDYTSARSIERFAISYYDDNDLGYGDNHDGVMLMLSMEERDYDLDFSGSQASSIFTESRRDTMEDRFLRYFREDDYYEGFSEYLDTCEEYLSAGASYVSAGYDRGGYSGRNDYGYGYDDGLSDAQVSGIAALICGAIAAVVVGVAAYAPMRSAKEQRDADQYVVHGGLNLRRRSDMFLNRTVSRRPRQTESRGGGGRGGRGGGYRGGHGGGGHGGGGHGGGHSYSSGGHSGRSGRF